MPTSEPRNGTHENLIYNYEKSPVSRRNQALLQTFKQVYCGSGQPPRSTVKVVQPSPLAGEGAAQHMLAAS